MTPKEIAENIFQRGAFYKYEGELAKAYLSALAEIERYREALLRITEMEDMAFVLANAKFIARKALELEGGK